MDICGCEKKLSRDFSPGNSSLFDTVRGLSYFKPFDFGWVVVLGPLELMATLVLFARTLDPQVAVQCSCGKAYFQVEGAEEQLCAASRLCPLCSLMGMWGFPATSLALIWKYSVNQTGQLHLTTFLSTHSMTNIGRKVALKSLWQVLCWKECHRYYKLVLYF